MHEAVYVCFADKLIMAISRLPQNEGNPCVLDGKATTLPGCVELGPSPKFPTTSNSKHRPTALSEDKRESIGGGMFLVKYLSFFPVSASLVSVRRPLANLVIYWWLGIFSTEAKVSYVACFPQNLRAETGDCSHSSAAYYFSAWM